MQQLVFDDHSRKIPAYRTENEPKGIKFQSISSGKLRNFTISSLIEPLNIQTDQISNH